MVANDVLRWPGTALEKGSGGVGVPAECSGRERADAVRTVAQSDVAGNVRIGSALGEAVDRIDVTSGGGDEQRCSRLADSKVMTSRKKCRRSAFEKEDRL
jgi:hypothetical protein